MGDDDGQAPTTPEATSTQAVNLTTPCPARRGVTPTGGATLPKGGPAPATTDTPQQVCPGNE